MTVHLRTGEVVMPEIFKTEFIKTEKEGRILTVTFNRPEVMNALHPQAHDECQAVFDAFEADPDLWVAIVTGAGDRSFCAGNDLKNVAGGGRLPFPKNGFAGLTARFRCVKPVIAAVNGLAVGGGFEVVLACDLAVASETAYFALPEARRGLAAVCGGPHRLIRHIPYKAAMGAILTGNKITAEKALHFGLVNEVVPQAEVMAAARRWAEQILECAPVSVRAMKQMAAEGLDEPTMEKAYHKGYDQVMAMFRSKDFMEGPMAFAQKRKPNWTGK